uniref:YitH acetyltransferase (GNAT) domain-containing protein n=1 Tax=Romanomermis culicivorax TaxID=13658 RepID=A0A915LAT7_ROMCU
MDEIVKIRPAERRDLPTIEHLAQKEDFHIGLQNWSLYFHTSKDCWQVAENGHREVVGYKVDNALADNVKFAFQLVLREDYRGRGLTRSFDTMHYSRVPTICNATAYSLSRYKFDHFSFGMVGFCGYLRNVEALKPQLSNNGLYFEEITESNIKDAYDYDFSVYGGCRSKFVKEWCLPELYPCEVISLLAKKDQKVCGYGVVREYEGYWTIAPLYADDDLVAQWLLYKLLSNFSDNENRQLYILTDVKNRVIRKFAQLLENMICCDSETRAVLNGDKVSEALIKRMATSKVYGFHDFWPV